MCACVRLDVQVGALYCVCVCQCVYVCVFAASPLGCGRPIWREKRGGRGGAG